jgi:ABC-type lipoprotein release transport system permease subunit
MYYIAVLGLSGAVFGALIGVLAGYIIRNIRF